MQVGIIGLGRMGANMSRRWVGQGHRVVGYARTRRTVEGLVRDGAISDGAVSLADLAGKLSLPRVIWLMVPAAAVDATLDELVPHLAPGDMVIDGGNSYYVDDIRRSKALVAQGIHYLDCGTSGGVWGLQRGYCLMIGGPAKRPWPSSTHSSGRSPRAWPRRRELPVGPAPPATTRRAICIAALPVPATS